jgi:hypothetical protein
MDLIIFMAARSHFLLEGISESCHINHPCRRLRHHRSVDTPHVTDKMIEVLLGFKRIHVTPLQINKYNLSCVLDRHSCLEVSHCDIYSSV